MFLGVLHPWAFGKITLIYTTAIPFTVQRRNKGILQGKSHVSIIYTTKSTGHRREWNISELDTTPTDTSRHTISSFPVYNQ